MQDLSFKYRLRNFIRQQVKRNQREVVFNDDDLPAREEDKKQGLIRKKQQDLVRKLVEQDSNGILKAEKMKKHQIDLQDICLMILDENTIADISKKTQIPDKSLYSFFTRSLEKPEVSNYFRRNLESIE